MEFMAEQAAEIMAMTSDQSGHDSAKQEEVEDSLPPVAQSQPKQHWPPPQSAFQSLPLVHPKRQHHHHKNHDKVLPVSPAAVSTKILNDSLNNLMLYDGPHEKVGNMTIADSTTTMGLPRHSHRIVNRRGSAHSINSFDVSVQSVVSSLEGDSPNSPSTGTSGDSRSARLVSPTRRRSSNGSSASSNSSMSFWNGFGQPNAARDFSVPNHQSSSSLSFNQHNRQSFASIDTEILHLQNSNTSADNKTALFDSLDLHWPNLDDDAMTKFYQQACLASFVVVFGNPCIPSPPASIVQGLWAKVVLPSLSLNKNSQEEDTSTPINKRDTDHLAQDAWTTLTSRMGFLTEQQDDSTVTVVHSAFGEYGLQLASTQFKKEAAEWTSKFALWLQDVFMTEKEASHVACYAAKALLPMLLELDMYQEATNMLLGSTIDYVARLWEILGDSENALQLTERYVVTNVEGHLGYQRDKQAAGDEQIQQLCSSQEILELYEAWHSLLHRKLEDLGMSSLISETSPSGPSSDVCSLSSNGASEDERSVVSSASATSEKQRRRQDRRQRRERRRQRRQQVQEERFRKKRHELLQDPLPILILGRALHALAESLMESSCGVSKDGESPTSLWRRQAEYLFQAIQIFSVIMINPPREEDDDLSDDEIETSKLQLFQRVAALLCADSWVAQSECLGKMQDSQCPVDEFQLLSLSSLFAPCIKTQICVNVTDPRINCLEMALALLENPMDATGSNNKRFRATHRLNIFRETLRGDINDAIGRLHFDRKLYELAGTPLDDAVRRKRLVLTLLREGETPNLDGGILPLWSSDNADTSEEEPTFAENIVQELCLHSPKDSAEKDIEHAELSLSQSLEYAALVMHERGFSMPALSLLQESLLLKAGHLSKSHMEVARLNAAMAVIHDDVMQWEAALPRRRECLRIRMQFLAQYDPTEWITQHEGVFRSVLETLRAMGNSHRMLEDFDSSIGCYWKIASLARRQWEVLRDDPDEITKFYGFSPREHQHSIGEELRKISPPTVVLDEIRHEPVPKNDETCFGFHGRVMDDEDLDDREDTVVREVAQAYQTIISLFKDKESASRRAQSSSTKSLADVIAEQDIPLLLTASYELGIVHMYYGDWCSAMNTFEHSLQCLWVMDPSSSETSGSDSYSDEESNKRIANRKRLQKRRRHHQSLGGLDAGIDEIYEEGLYHAVGLCRVGCSQHEQAIRFLMTALRYARRYHGANSPLVAKILYDVATCYWNVRQYEKALEFWNACCHIHLQKEVAGVDSEDSTASDQTDTALDTMGYAKALYNVGTSLCAMSCFRNHPTLTCFEEARDIFAERREEKSYELASCLFYMSQTIYHQAGKDSDLLNKANDLLIQSKEIYQGLGMVPSNNETDQSLDDNNEVLQAHFFCLQGSIYLAMGDSELALGSFQTAYGLYDSDSVSWSLHKAAVLFEVGKIYKKWEENVGALRCFDEAMEIRISRLGPGHEVVGANLHELGDMFAHRGDFEVAMEMYNEARRILVATGGQDNPLVAKVLLHLGALQARQGLLGDALESLKGALVIRNNRAGTVYEASRCGDSSTTINLRKESSNELKHDGVLRKQFHQDQAHERQELAVVLHCMGNVHNALGDYENAVLSYDKAIETWKCSTESRPSNEDIPISLADSLHCLGCVYFKQKAFDKALECLMESLEVQRNPKRHMLCEDSAESAALSAEPAHSIVLHNAKEDSSNNGDVVSLSYANTLHSIGMVHSRMSNRDAAVSCLKSCLTIQKRLLDAESPEIAVTLADMGNTLYSAKHRRDEALQYYQQALAIRKSQHHSHSRAAGELMYRIGSLHDADRQAAQAMLYYRQAVQVYGRSYVHSVSKRLCRAVLLRSNSSSESDDDETDNNIDLFRAEDFSSAAESVEEREEHQRDHFRQVCAAMRRVATSQNSVDVPSPSCFISLELYLYSLMDLLHLVAGEWRHAARQSLQNGMRQLQGTPSTTAMPSSSQDMMLFHMLYLIQE